MAVTTTFKQQCPSCEAMITVKDNLIGKKVECTKCKDKFIAKKPVEDDIDDVDEVEEEPAKKNTKVAAKKSTAVNGKSPPGKRAKLEVEDDEADEEESPKGKNGKAKSNTNGKAKSASKQADEEDDDDDEGDHEAAQKKKKKLTIGLALAGVGVVILVIAAFFVLRGSRPPSNTGIPGKPPGGDIVQGDKDKKGPIPVIDNKPVEVVAVSLTDSERAKLSNLLPNDTEQLFRANFKELFDTAGSLRTPVFQTKGALNDDDLKRQLGFSILAIDDLICAERVTSPWRFTVIHFKDLINEKDLKTALKLKAVGKGIEGQVYYKMEEVHPWFNQLSRFSFGVPNNLRALDPPNNRATYVRVHNGQTLIIADETPMLAFLKAKGQFAMLSTPSASSNSPPAAGINGGNPMPGTMTGMMGGNPMPGAMVGGNPVPMPMPPGPGMMGGNPVPMPMPPGPGMMGGNPVPMPMPPMRPMPIRPMPTSTANPQGLEFTGFVAEQQPPPVPMPGPGPNPNPMPGPGPNPMPGPGPNPMPGPGPGPMPGPGPNSGPSPNPNPNPAAGTGTDSYMTIKPALKAVMDRMEAHGADGKEKVLLSSATDMDATCLDVRSDVKTMVPRRSRQFWDVTLLLNETKPRIRYLGTSLVQYDSLRYRLRNEITCGVEGDAKDFTDQLADRGVASGIARFFKAMFKHEVKVNPLASATVVPVQQPPNPTPLPPGAQPEPKDEKKSQEPTESQITIKQQFTTVDFTLDLILDGSTLTQARAIAALNASIMRVEMESTLVSLRHQLAAAGKTLGEKGLSQRQIQVPAGQLPPGAFERLSDPTPGKPPPLRVDREPKNRISFLAAMLPYMGHQNLFDRLHFEQSWRDPGNWLPGQTVVPQFLDPSYPVSKRQVAFPNLPVDFAATHYVGIAGVGLDAASYKRNDPATAHLRGPFSYDDSASLSEFKRGAANTILMIQIPHDGPTGVSPWIAGGGATLRGIPEQNSFAPFIAVNDGKKKGTYAMMADGSVRFIDQSISNDVFKAMGTLQGPAPADFADEVKKYSDVIPPPKDQKDAKEEKADPIKAPNIEKPPVDKTPVVKKQPDTPPLPAGIKGAIQGEWVLSSMEMDGKVMPTSPLSEMIYQIESDLLVIRVKNQQGIRMQMKVFGYSMDIAQKPARVQIGGGTGKPELAIVEVNNNEMRLCLGTQGYPTAFKSAPGSGLVLQVFKRKAPVPVSPVDDLQELQGSWTASFGEINGVVVPQLKVLDVRLNISGNNLAMRISPQREDQFTFKIDPGKFPKHLDKMKTGLGTSLGIYQLKYGELWLCSAIADVNPSRPTSFITRPGSQTGLFVLRKQNK